jgi:hypothetical protein
MYICSKIKITAGTMHQFPMHTDGLHCFHIKYIYTMLSVFHYCNISWNRESRIKFENGLSRAYTHIYKHKMQLPDH